jgi:hypothetical protein
MSFLEEVKKTFLNKEELLNLRVNSSKYLFIFCCLLFFLDYYFIANKFLSDYLLNTLSVVFIIFLVSFFLYSCFLFTKLFLVTSKVNQAILYLLLFLIISIFSLPFIFPK